jgi:hypothetical protein
VLGLLHGAHTAEAEPHWGVALPAEPVVAADLSGRELYMQACSTCHGVDGTGMDPQHLGFDVVPADFTDCSFATREADLDWGYVVTKGGPARGFSRFMPAFGEAMTHGQIQKTLDHVRTFCPDDSWPRGEFNLPRALFTTKAYPEDELVVEIDADPEDRESVVATVLYEQRFGPRSQWEVSLPFGWREQPDAASGDGSGDWDFGVGDAAVGLKHVVFDDLDLGSLVSLGAELILPTGDEDDGFSDELWIFEPYVTFGQLLPADFFIQAQAGLGLPVDKEAGRATHNEAFWRASLGRTFFLGEYGRALSPQVEILGAREWTDEADTLWDVAPQIQIPLNRRQHVRIAFGARIPINNTDVRETTYRAYLLWDWFDGGFFEGW